MSYRDEIVDAIIAEYPDLKEADRKMLERYRAGEGTVLSFRPPEREEPS